MLEVAVPAAGAGKSGVDVEVGVEHAVAVRSPVDACPRGRSDTAMRDRQDGGFAVVRDAGSETIEVAAASGGPADGWPA
jgi:hypothetical protein